jgi:hypothetical protein
MRCNADERCAAPGYRHSATACAVGAQPERLGAVGIEIIERRRRLQAGHIDGPPVFLPDEHHFAALPLSQAGIVVDAGAELHARGGFGEAACNRITLPRRSVAQRHDLIRTPNDALIDVDTAVAGHIKEISAAVRRPGPQQRAPVEPPRPGISDAAGARDWHKNPGAGVVVAVSLRGGRVVRPHRQRGGGARDA